MVATATLLRDTLFFIKDLLDGNVTDPISSTRPVNQTFIMTSYPSRPVRYPLITIKDTNVDASISLGLQSEAHMLLINIEIRAWGRTIKERDEMAQEIYNTLLTNQIGASGTSQASDLHDFKLISSVNVDEDEGPKSKVMTIQYMFVAN